MNNQVRDLLHEDAAELEFAEFLPADDSEHPVHQAIVMALNRSVGPIMELVHDDGFGGSDISFCKYPVVIDPLEFGSFPKDALARFIPGTRLNVSLKYAVYETDLITFPPSKNGKTPRYLKLLHQLVKFDHLLIGSLSWVDQPADCWEEVESSFATGCVISVRVVDIGFNYETQKGGLIVQCGLLRGFVPAGLVDFRPQFYGKTLEEILRSMVGKTIKVKAIKVDREDKQLIFSEIAAQDEIRRAQKADFLANVRIGDQLMGFVTNVQPLLGIFVRVGECCDGLVRPENLIGETPELHQPVTVEVINVNRERGHLNLRLDNMIDLEALDAEAGDNFSLSALDDVEPDLSVLDS